MDCRQCKDELGPYLDGDLTRDRAPMRRAELDQHLARCPSCHRFFTSCHQTIQAFRTQPAPPLPAAIHRRMMQKVARQAGHPSSSGGI